MRAAHLLELGMTRFAGLMQAGLVDPAPIVDRRFRLEEINDAFAAAEAREVLAGVVVSG